MFTAILCAAFATPPSTPVVNSKRDGTPGDPINLRLIGMCEELVRAFYASGWVSAHPATARSAVRIGASVVLNRPYPSAPVSDLYLFDEVTPFTVVAAASSPQLDKSMSCRYPNLPPLRQ